MNQNKDKKVLIGEFLKLVEIENEEGILFATDHIFQLTGVIRLAIKNNQNIACSTILEEIPVFP